MGFASSLKGVQSLKRVANSDAVKVLADKEKRSALVDRAQGMVSSNQDQIHGAIKKAGSAVSEKTGGKYDAQISKLSDAATSAVGKVAGGEDRPGA